MSGRPSSHLTRCHPILLLPLIFPSIRVFSSESVLRIKWANYCCFSFSIGPSNGYSGLMSFRMDWFDLLSGNIESAFITQGDWACLIEVDLIEDRGKVSYFNLCDVNMIVCISQNLLDYLFKVGTLEVSHTLIKKWKGSCGSRTSMRIKYGWESRCTMASACFAQPPSWECFVWF